MNGNAVNNISVARKLRVLRRSLRWVSHGIYRQVLAKNPGAGLSAALQHYHESLNRNVLVEVTPWGATLVRPRLTTNN
jgi:hypothetical protein